VPEIQKYEKTMARIDIVVVDVVNARRHRGARAPRASRRQCASATSECSSPRYAVRGPRRIQRAPADTTDAVEEQPSSSPQAISPEGQGSRPRPVCRGSRRKVDWLTMRKYGPGGALEAAPAAAAGEGEELAGRRLRSGIGNIPVTSPATSDPASRARNPMTLKIGSMIGAMISVRQRRT
jgi:hypothetical protein